MKIAVVSGKSGVGRTSVSLLLANAVTPSVYVDLSTPLIEKKLYPDLIERDEIENIVPIPRINLETCTFCGLCSKKCHTNAITIERKQGIATVSDEDCVSCGVCTEVCPIGDAIAEVLVSKGTIRKRTAGDLLYIDYQHELKSKSATLLASEILSRVPEDSRPVIMDSPSGNTSAIMEIMSFSDVVLMIVDPSTVSLRKIPVFHDLAIDLGKPFALIENKVLEGIDLIENYALQEDIELIHRMNYSRKFAFDFSNSSIRFEEYCDTFKEVYSDLERVFVSGVY